MESPARATWKKGIEYAFDGRPEVCPRCGSAMLRLTVYHYAAVREMKKIWRTHSCEDGFFIPYTKEP